LTTSLAPPENVLRSHNDCVLAAAEAVDLGRANPILADDADSHPYAYSVSPDKATKATLADKMDGDAPLWT
jgi:hypothetical protein